MIRRFLPMLAIAGLLSVVLAGSAVAGGGGGGGGGFLIPGRTTQEMQFATTFLQNASGSVQVNAIVQAGTLTFKAKGTSGPPISMPGTLVEIGVGGNVQQGGFACWMIPDSMFTVNKDLSATLHFRSDALGVSLCLGFALVSGSPSSGIVPLGGGGGGGGSTGFLGPVALDLIFQTGTPLFESRSTTNATCAPFSGSFNTSFTDNLGSSATGTVSATLQGFDTLGNPIPVPINASLTSQFADVNVQTSKQEIHGPTTGFCGPFGS